jgi:hypothetical protein
VRAIAVDRAGHRTTSDEVLFQIGPQVEAPPLLAMRPDDGGMQVSWEVESGRYRLQATDGLKEPVVWINVSRFESTGGGTTFVPVPAGQKERFFRLMDVP